MSETIDQGALAAQILAEHQRAPHDATQGPALRVHVTLHAVVETQLRLGDPPEVQRTLDRLMREGLDRHRAVHAICSVVAREFTEVMGDGRRFDHARYAAALGALSAADG